MLRQRLSIVPLVLLLLVFPGYVLLLMMSSLNKFFNSAEIIERQIDVDWKPQTKHLNLSSAASSAKGRKPVFFLHISKAGGTYTLDLASANGEVMENLRWLDSSCRYLSTCASNVTFVQFEHSMGSLTPEELEILFPSSGKESRWLTFVQVRKPKDLEASWFLEGKYGYKHPNMINMTFSEYISPQWYQSDLKRFNSLLHFLGTDRDFGRIPDMELATQTAIDNVKRFDVVTLVEDREQTRDVFRSVFGWEKFSTTGPSRKHKHDSDLELSTAQQELIMEMLKPDEQVYQLARNRSRETLVRINTME